MKPFDFKNYIKNNPLLKEVSLDTFKSAVEKSKERGSDRRTVELGRLNFNQFNGKDLFGGKIARINYHSPQQGSFSLVEIIVEIPDPNNSGKTKEVAIGYNVDKDKYDDAYEKKEISVQDARTLSLIAQKINPDTKYKNQTAAFKIKGHQ